MNKLNLLNKWMHRMIIMCDMCSWFMNENNCKKKNGWQVIWRNVQNRKTTKVTKHIEYLSLQLWLCLISNRTVQSGDECSGVCILLTTFHIDWNKTNNNRIILQWQNMVWFEWRFLVIFWSHQNVTLISYAQTHSYNYRQRIWSETKHTLNHIFDEYNCTKNSLLWPHKSVYCWVAHSIG